MLRRPKHRIQNRYLRFVVAVAAVGRARGETTTQAKSQRSRYIGGIEEVALKWYLHTKIIAKRISLILRQTS